VLSSSDQTDYRINAIISASVVSGLTPEQCAVWSHPLRDGDREEVVMNMVNALLVRIHQSGHLAELSAERRALVAEGIRCYKRIRSDIPQALPLWPLGMPRFGDEHAVFALRGPRATYLAVWRFGGERDSIEIPLGHLAGSDATTTLLYPSADASVLRWNRSNGAVTVRLPQRFSARLYEVVANPPAQK